MALLWSQSGAGGLGLVAQLCHPQLGFHLQAQEGGSPLSITSAAQPIGAQEHVEDSVFHSFNGTATQYFLSHLTGQNLLHDPVL